MSAPAALGAQAPAPLPRDLTARMDALERLLVRAGEGSGVYFFLGGRRKDVSVEQAPAHHTPDFHVEDTDLEVGVKAFVGLVRADGGWRMAVSGEWRVESGEWRMESDLNSRSRPKPALVH